MKHFTNRERKGREVQLNKSEFVNAITELLASSEFEYLVAGEGFQKQLDMLFNKVIIANISGPN